MEATDNEGAMRNEMPPNALPGQSPSTQPSLDYATPARRQSWLLFIAAQVPAVLGATCIGSVMAGLVGFDPFGAIVGMAIMTTFAGSLLSILLSLCFFKGIHKKAGIWAAGLHACYLVVWVIVIAYAVTRPPRYRGPGGF